MSEELCSNCKFFSDENLICRRYPPNGAAWSKPDPTLHDWCGEWKSRVPLPAIVIPATREGNFFITKPRTFQSEGELVNWICEFYDSYRFVRVHNQPAAYPCRLLQVKSVSLQPVNAFLSRVVIEFVFGDLP